VIPFLAIKSLDLVFNIMSIFSDKGYEVKSIIIDRPLINALVLEDGSANWDIMKRLRMKLRSRLRLRLRMRVINVKITVKEI